jgi:CDP-glycerol glycerophosphotransferase (TagB/SpsB family)
MHAQLQPPDVVIPERPGHPGSDTLTMPGLLSRIEATEALGDQISQAIDQLVDAVLGLQQPAAPVADAGPGAEAFTALERRLQALEQQVHLNQACQELTRTAQFHPKERSVVFVGTTYFGCNVKYAWLAFRARARQEGITAWFLPQTEQQEQAVTSLGEACFPLNPNDWSTAHVHAALSAAVVVTCDHLLNPNPYAAALLAGARHVQLWHGVSIKEIGLRNLAPLRQMSARFARVLSTCGPYTRLVGTSAGQESEWRRWFGFEQYAPIGYPRNDVLLREPDAADLLNVDLEIYQLARKTRAAGKRVVLYAPTFRDARRGTWLLESGLEQLAQGLARRGDLLVVNVHPVESPLIPQLSIAMPSARFVTPRTDLYPVMRETSLLITDYSSVMFDYLLLDRPIVLFRPDHQDYVTRSRQLFDAKLDEHPGPMATSVQALLDVLRQPDAQGRTYAPTRAAMRQRLFDHTDGRSGDRFGQLLLEELGTALHQSWGASPCPKSCS